jgi:hypothetical protein
LSFFHCLIAGFQDPASINQKRFPSCRQCHAFPFSLEQVNSEFALQGLDLLAKGRLRHVQPIGSMGEIQLLSGSDKIFQVAKFH